MDSSSEDSDSSYDDELAALGLSAVELEGDEAQGGAPADAREPIYNADALHERLEDIGWSEQAPWGETQVVTSSGRCEVEDVDDDLTRELAFYQQALGAAKEAIGRFEAAGTPWLRPPDYYAEMVKSDGHMAKVKEQLMYEQKQIEAADERRKARESKRFQKQLQAERLKAKAQEKKKAITDVQKLRKMREKSLWHSKRGGKPRRGAVLARAAGFEGDFDYDAALENMDKKSPAKRLRAGERPMPGKKRMYKNEKFGFGGRKRAQKRNDAKSAADMDGYRAPTKPGSKAKPVWGTPKAAGMGARGGGVGKKKGGKGKPNRPGKARRAAMRGGK